MGKKVAVFACGCFEEVVELRDNQDPASFCAGVSLGGSYFGDSAWAFVWPEDEAELRESHIDKEEIAAALKALGVSEHKSVAPGDKHGT